MHHYHKLIRDKIPEIYVAKGREISYHDAASDEEYWAALKYKLQEEMDEFGRDPTEEKLADVYEVLDAILEFRSLDHELVREVKGMKRNKLGGFYRRYVLDQSPDDMGPGIIEPL